MVILLVCVGFHKNIIKVNNIMKYKSHPLYRKLEPTFGCTTLVILSYLDTFYINKQWYRIENDKVYNQKNEVGFIIGTDLPWGSNTINPPESVFFPKLIKLILENNNKNAYEVYQMLIDKYGSDRTYNSLCTSKLLVKWVPSDKLVNIVWVNNREKINILSSNK
jgi:hypothetical protein